MKSLGTKSPVGNTYHMLNRSIHASTSNVFGLLLGAAVAVACSGNNSAGGSAGVGGADSTGGSGSDAGSTSLGGNSATDIGGSTAAAGGELTTGGAMSSGGVPATGGIASTGGAVNVGGAATGGAVNVGGAATGGAVNVGGAANTGGAVNVGGANTGGSKAAGGAATGGAMPTGGTTSTGGASSTAGATSTSSLPQLHVEGNVVKDPNGKTIILRGVSLIDIGNLYYAGGQKAAGITTRIDKILAAGLLPHVLRMPVYPRTCVNGTSPAYSQVPYPIGPAAPSGTHIAVTADQYLNSVLKPAVDYAAQKGMYAIVDFHQIDNAATGTSAADATTFWQYMASQFASYTNVIYEPFNEPIDSAVTWANFKSVAQGWVDTIRAAAPNNIIIVPSMSYDQHPGDAADSPLTGTNLMYTAHIYPGNWSTAFKAQVANAVTKVPVFMTEWGYVLNGTDRNLGTAVATWGTDFRTLVDSEGASWTAWVTDSGWQPNMFTSTALTTLTDFGNVTMTWLSDTAASDWVQ